MKSEPVLKKIKLSKENEVSSSDIDDPDEIEDDVKEEVKESKIVVKSTAEVKANFFNEELTSDDEILTFQCPENFNMNLLLNKSLSPSKVTTVEENEDKYNCYVLPNMKNQLTCVLPGKTGNAKIVNVPVAGHIVVKKEFNFPKIENSSGEDDEVDEMDEMDEMDETDETDDSDSESEDETVRHPLLGKNYEEHLKTVMQHLRKYKKLLKKSLKHEKSLEKAEKERKEQKKKLKVELSLLKKHGKLNESSISIH